MTELLAPDRLRRIARVLDQPAAAPRRPVLVLQWSVDEASGRPVGRWVPDAASNEGYAR
nr:hypothetical protein [uncultured Rhodopila sp.]